MFCPECGTQIPDVAKFCSHCGKSVPELSGFTADKTVNSQPSFAGTPSFEPPLNYVRVTPLKTPNKKPVIIAACCAAAAVAVALAVLFAVILPNQGLSGKIRHKWLNTEGVTDTFYDFKKKVVTGNNVSIPFKWKAKGDDCVSLTISIFGIPVSQEYIVSFSDDEMTMTLTSPDNGVVSTYTRVD